MDVVSAPIAVAPRAADVGEPAVEPAARAGRRAGRGANRSRVGRRRPRKHPSRRSRRFGGPRRAAPDSGGRRVARAKTRERAQRERARAARPRARVRPRAGFFGAREAQPRGISLVSVATVVLETTECFFADGENLRAAPRRRRAETPSGRIASRSADEEEKAERHRPRRPTARRDREPVAATAAVGRVRSVGRRDAARGAAAAPAVRRRRLGLGASLEYPSHRLVLLGASDGRELAGPPAAPSRAPAAPGITAGDVVWVRLRGSLRSGAKRKNPPAAAATAAAGDVPGEPVGGAEAEAEASGVWWPGRAWKLRHCASAAALWRDRGAPPSVPRALVRCFGDGSFVWAAPEDLERYGVEEDERRPATEEALPEASSRDAPSALCSAAALASRRGFPAGDDAGDDANRETEPVEPVEPVGGGALRVLPGAERNVVAAEGVHPSVSVATTSLRVLPTASLPASSHSSRAARRTAALLAAASIRSDSSRKARATGGLRGVTPATARKALLEAEEAALLFDEWDPPWSDSEGENPAGDEGGDGVAGRPPNGRLAERSSLLPRPPAGPTGTYRAFEARADGERDGLTPDWIIDAGCRVFQLEPPTVDRPIIAGLLDPCTNDRRRPNIPAAKTYDREQDGLRQENAWRGYHVILNPSYESSVQWRFINRAINEVEWGHCPGILMVCRNSTDTSYFQRLLPFPRVFLRRDAIRFKDYEHTPIGFGIAVFCLVSPTLPKSEKMATYRRFFDEFQHAGEFDVPFDREFLHTAAFEELTDRLHVDSAKRFRDSWVACDACDRWREIPPTQSLAGVRARETWRCEYAFPGLGCDAPLTDREFKAFSVARKGHALALSASEDAAPWADDDAAAEARAKKKSPTPPTPTPTPRGENAKERASSLDEEETESEETESDGEEEDADAWAKAEKREEDVRDPGEESDDAPAAADRIAEPWLDEVSLRGGRRRFGFGETGDARRAKEEARRAENARPPREDPRRARAARRARRGGGRGRRPLDGRGSLRGGSGVLALTISRGGASPRFAPTAMFPPLAPPRRPPSAKERAASALVAAIARAAETSSAVAAAKRVETAAAAAAERAKVAAEDARRRERAARAAANVAAREADAATRVERDALADSRAARAMVVRLEERAREADAACDAAERLAQRSR